MALALYGLLRPPDDRRLDRGQGGSEKLVLVDSALEAQARRQPSQLHRHVGNVPGRRGGEAGQLLSGTVRFRVELT